MAWQTPKTNWQAADVVRKDDFNRIEGNIQHLQDTKETPAGAQAKAEAAAGAVRAELNAHLADNTNPHNVTKSQVGLSKVENMSATEIRTATNRSLKVEVISSSGSETPEQGRIIFDMSQGKFFGGNGSEWV